MNASQVFDPVALFGSLNFTAARSVSNLHQYNSADGSILTALRPVDNRDALQHAVQSGLGTLNFKHQ